MVYTMVYHKRGLDARGECMELATAPKSGKRISYREAKYLKHCGRLMDVKVTIRPFYGQTSIFIRDYMFSTFEQSLRCLQHIATTELAGTAKEGN